MMSGGKEEGSGEFYENSLGICGVERKAYVTAFLDHLVNRDFAVENVDKIRAGRS